MVDDNDDRGVTVSTDSLNIAAGSTATYTVMLNTQPERTVYISVTEDPNNDNPGVRVSPSRLSFSTSSWNRPQTVTVRTNSDATGAVTVQHAIETTSSSRDEDYDGAAIANEDVTITVSPAQPGIRLSSSSLSVDEGASRTYTVRLFGANRECNGGCGRSLRFGSDIEWRCVDFHGGQLEYGADGDGDCGRGRRRRAGRRDR